MAGGDEQSRGLNRDDVVLRRAGRLRPASHLGAARALEGRDDAERSRGGAANRHRNGRHNRWQPANEHRQSAGAVATDPVTKGTERWKASQALTSSTGRACSGSRRHPSRSGPTKSSPRGHRPSSASRATAPGGRVPAEDRQDHADSAGAQQRFGLPVLVLTHKRERGKPDVEGAGEAETVGRVKEIGIPENPASAWIAGWVTRKPRTLP
jgi:hypothetical protein